MANNKKVNIEFVPGCFDNFQGTQEELDAFVAEISKLVESFSSENDLTEVDVVAFSDLGAITLEEHSGEEFLLNSSRTLH